MSNPRDIHRCHKCGTPTHINLLDAKDDGTGNFTILECETCYGPGWEPACGATKENPNGTTR